MDTLGYARAKKVIDEAASSLLHLREFDEAFWRDLIGVIHERKGKIVLMGIGKSGYIAMKVAATLTSLGHYATFVHPVEAMHGDSGAVANGDIVIAFSFSGNTKELVSCVRHLKACTEVTLIGVTGGEGSALASLSDRVVPVRIREEGCPLKLAPMASTTAMLVFGDALAAGLTSPEEFTHRDFARFHPSGTLGLALTPVEVRAHMNKEVSVSHTTPLRETLEKIGDLGKGLIAVVNEEGTLVGSITDGDVRRFFTQAETHEAPRAEHVMSQEPKYITPDKSLKDALFLMEMHKITNLFVVDEELHPIGIIHIHDIIEV